eukprot:1321813-Amphidinium_carterae.2
MNIARKKKIERPTCANTLIGSIYEQSAQGSALTTIVAGMVKGTDNMNKTHHNASDLHSNKTQKRGKTVLHEANPPKVTKYTKATIPIAYCPGITQTTLLARA